MTRIRTLALLAAPAVALTMLVTAPPTSAAEPTVTDGCIPSVPETDPLAPGPVDICFTVFKPVGASADTPVPMVLHSHGWGGSRTRTASSFQGLLDARFGVLSFDQRGFGESGGKAHVEDPAFEGEDVINIVDHVAGLDWVRQEAPGDPLLGAIGGSYGGGYQFVGAFTELMKAGQTRFDTLVPEITWYSIDESLAPQKVARTEWVSALYAAGAEAHTSTVHEGFTEGAATGDWPASLEEFFRDNDPEFHVQQGRRLDIPVLLRQGISDNLFPLEQAIDNYDRALTDAARSQSILVGYNGGHAIPSTVPPGYATDGDACSGTLGDASIRGWDDLQRAFLAENLHAAPRVLTGHGRYHLTTADGACQSVDSVQPTRTWALPDIETTTVTGAPQAVKIADGPLTVAGSPFIDALVSTTGTDARAFFALSVGTSPTDARVIQHNVLPHRQADPVTGAQRRIELPSVAAEVPADQSLFLTVSPVADMFGGHGSRTPGTMRLEDVAAHIPAVG
jgi:ABC-2 type transport system ATP-binding protein